MTEAARNLFSIKVPIIQLMVPIDSSLRVTPGPIPADIVKRMEKLDFDFAVVEEEIWDGDTLAMLKALGLISRTRLDQLWRANSPSMATEPVILKTSLHVDGNGELNIHTLFTQDG